MIDFATRTTEKGTIVIRLGGKLDSESNEYFFECVKDEIDNGHLQIVINCSDLGYISSVGLASLMRARNRLSKSGGQIYLACVDSRILDLLHLVHFDRLFHIFPTEQEAIDAIEK